MKKSVSGIKHTKKKNTIIEFCIFELIDNQLHRILRPFDVLPNLSFTTRETMGDYYLQTWYLRRALRVAERLKT